MLKEMIPILIIVALLIMAPALADDLTQMIQQDLVAQGYDTGGTDGEMTMQTAIAISQFQSEYGLEVTGEVSPQLAGTLRAVGRGQYQAGSNAATSEPAVVEQPSGADLQARQEACLQEKVAAAQKKQKKKRGLGSLMRAVSRTATQFGNNDMAQTISQTTYDVYNVSATAADLESAAKDLGLTTNEVEECRNP